MRWVEIINVLVNSDGFILIIKDNDLIGMKYFDVPFCKDVDMNNFQEVQKLCLNIQEYSDEIKYITPSLAQLIRDCVNVLLDGKSVGSWVQDDFYFKRNELC